ncbi:MAG: outer membrane beta-barrel protein, partial [Lutimonas sp.]
VYLNSLQQGSPISENLRNNAISSDEAFSYGVKVNYQLTDKINIQSGLNRLELGYNTKDVNLSIASSKYPNNNINAKNSAIYLSSSQNSRPNIESSTVAGKTDIEGELNQSFEYLEIPLEMKYNLFESKVGLNLVGGFSTYILTDNQVSFVLPNLNETKIGEANNLNSFNFSGNLGFDIDYKITQDWFLNVTPMLKYQFNTFSNSSGNFQPYYFGVYSGVNYRF